MNAPTQNVFVTGAGGFIGKALVATLLRDGHAVSALLLPSEQEPAGWQGRVRVVRGDICDAAAVKQALAGHQVVIHLAAMVGDWGAEALHEKVTVGGTRNVLDAMIGTPAHLVLVSSIVVYGGLFGRTRLSETLSIGSDLVSPYDRSKVAQESLLRRYAQEHALSYSVVRPGNVFGPASGPWVQTMLAEMRRGSPVLIGGGRFDAGLAYVDNVVDMLVLAAFHPAARGEVFNAADGAGVSWRSYLADLAAMAGLPAPKSLNGKLACAAASTCERLWRWLNLGGRPPLTHMALRLLGNANEVSMSKAKRLLGYQPAVSYDVAMQRIAAWLVEQK
ncbi:NAD(P)-dependent oxidoreductase [Jeongeupia wiesaeckerbachi]|uniref:NAD-dependent epimerase/dehydratase family protein n=1 Tax=Jeongeupia wiesaeckerbachi TaxID=3051218 RepID=UPI003D808DCD